MSDNSVQDVLNYTGTTLMTMNCILSGLTSQLKATQGSAAVEAAKVYALSLASKMEASPDVGPDINLINSFFDKHK